MQQCKCRVIKEKCFSAVTRILIYLNAVVFEALGLHPVGDQTTSTPTGFQCPQTLTAAVAEVWVGAHYILVEPRQNRRKGFFLKGVN